MEYVVDKKLNPDREYYGFTLRTRQNYYDDHIIREVLKDNTYKITENPGVVIDIGANIGTFTLLAARTGAKVYAYEPELSNYEVLCHNVTVNGFTDRVECIRKGVGKAGTTKLYVHPDTSGGASAYLEVVNGLNPNNYQTVKFISIREVFNGIGHCGILKLDCEGAELEILRDFDAQMSKKVDRIAIEFHPNSGKDEAIKKLCSFGYIPWETDHRRRTWVFHKD